MTSATTSAVATGNPPLQGRRRKRKPSATVSAEPGTESTETKRRKKKSKLLPPAPPICHPLLSKHVPSSPALLAAQHQHSTLSPSVTQQQLGNDEPTPPPASPVLAPIGLILGRCKCPSDACHQDHGHASSYNVFVQKNERNFHSSSGQIKIHACETCYSKRQKCSLVRPCARCIKLGIPCTERVSNNKRRKLDKVIEGRFCPLHGCDISQVSSDTTVSTPGAPPSPVSEHILTGRVGMPVFQNDVASYTVPPSPVSLSTASSYFAPSPVSIVGGGLSSEYASTSALVSPSRVISNIDQLLAQLNTRGSEEPIAPSMAPVLEDTSYGVEILFSELIDMAGVATKAIVDNKFSKAPIYGLHDNEEAINKLEELFQEDLGVSDAVDMTEGNAQGGYQPKLSTEDLELEELLRSVRETMEQNYSSAAQETENGNQSIMDINFSEGFHIEDVEDIEMSWAHNTGSTADPVNGTNFVDLMELDLSGDDSWLANIPNDWQLDFQQFEADSGPRYCARTTTYRGTQ